MPSLSCCAKCALLVVPLLLGACATSVSVADLSRPNFGVQVLPHLDASVDPDPMAIANGLYRSRPLQNSCYTCAAQSPLNWAGWSP